MTGRFFERLEKCIGSADGQSVGVVNHADLSISDEGPIHDLLFDLTNLLNFDLRRRQFRIRLEDEVIGMCTGIDLVTGPADSTGIEIWLGWMPLAEKRLRKGVRRCSLADRIFTVKQIGMRQ